MKYCLQGQGDCDGAQIDIVQNYNNLACDCDFYTSFPAFGCKISVAPPSGYACKCFRSQLNYCVGILSLCKDVNDGHCQTPDLTPETCNQGGGDCYGYIWVVESQVGLAFLSFSSFYIIFYWQYILM